MIKYLISISFSSILILSAKEHSLDRLNAIAYRQVEHIFVSRDFKEAMVSPSEVDLKKITKDAWEFTKFAEANELQKEELFKILDRGDFVPIKINAIFERDHLCILFKFVDHKDNIALMIIPGSPERAGMFYEYKEVGDGIVLGKRISPRLRVQGIYEIFIPDKK
ncbi:hypothetical protein JIN85_15615 [Luteolibacter pohnpeiensis]|uniref:Uncharacterized protein n=1 Tax=Luteolibacter pohnpeiensis TaxID=454153 RepID=A0A934S9I4_9BACT|nr:hypothetical protein [Luteolibacter pohnpeiensis]MBK1883845.1 hypothetical protein [Luteolibacter pohnpeiensis]